MWLSTSILGIYQKPQQNYLKPRRNCWNKRKTYFTICRNRLHFVQECKLNNIWWIYSIRQVKLCLESFVRLGEIWIDFANFKKTWDFLIILYRKLNVSLFYFSSVWESSFFLHFLFFFLPFPSFQLGSGDSPQSLKSAYSKIRERYYKIEQDFQISLF